MQETSTPTVPATTISTPTESEMIHFYKSLELSTGKPPLLSLVPSFSDRYIPLSAQGVLPKPLTSLFDAGCLNLPEAELKAKCLEIARSITISVEQASCVEEKTRRQALSKLWFQQRAGRVTASKLKQATRTNLMRPSTSLIKSICYPESHGFHGNKATMWGCEHEQEARQCYMETMAPKHTEMAVSTCELCSLIHHTLFGCLARWFDFLHLLWCWRT